jgi:hypothetical protein
MDDNPLGLGPKTVRWLGHRTVDVPDDRPSAADGSR